MNKTLATAAIVSTLVVACSSEPMITDRDVLVYENKGQLQELYNQLNTELSTFKPKSKHAINRTEFLTKVGTKIAEEKEREILNSIDRDVTRHNITRLNEALAQTEGIKQYNVDIYNELKQKLQKEISFKESTVKKKRAEFDRHSDVQAPRKVELLEQMAELTGGQEADKLALEKKAYIDSLFQSAEAAMVSKRYEDTIMLLDNLDKVHPEYPGVQEMRHKLISAEHEQKFWDALGSGETDRAYAVFKKLMQIPNYMQNHPDMVPVVEQIGQFFIAEGDKLMGTYSVSSAYQAYSRARFVQNSLGKQDVYTAGEKKFIEFIDKRLQKHADNEETVPAYGFLSILEELNPDHPSVAKYGQAVNNAMLDSATIKLIPSAFTEAQSKRSMGRGIVSKINQQLMEQLPTKIQVIEGAKAASNYSTEQVKLLPNPSSYYFLSGEILEANVDQAEKPANLTKRVLTSYKRVENPDYIAWTQLKKREKKKTPEPEATVEQPVEEVITINRSIVEKHGAFSITYRLSDALTASVAFSDALNKKQSFSGENVAGVELGLYVQQAQVANLPSDGDILKELSGEVAKEAAGKIAEQIIKLEQNYLKRADNAVVSEDFNTAAANYGYMNVLKQAQNKPDEELLSNLRRYAIRWK